MKPPQLISTKSRRGAFIAHAWLFGGGLGGAVVALAIGAAVPVASETVSVLLGFLAIALVGAGFLAGGSIGIEHEDRYERRRTGLTRRP